MRSPRRLAEAVPSGPLAVAGIAALGVGGLALGTGALAWLLWRAKRRWDKQPGDSVVLITGGSRGLGLALAEEFGRLDAKLVLAARDVAELERAKENLCGRIGISANRILTVTADLRNPGEAENLIQRATETFGRVDVLINNAGIITAGPVENQTVENFHEVMNTNLFAGVHCTLAVLPQMLSRKCGTIVNIASIGGKIAVPHLLPYTASKFAAVGFSQGLYAEVRSKGVHVLTVCPGLMRTGSHLNALFSGDAPREYRWFSLLASLPGVSVSARQAARRIVRAVLSEETEIAISPQAILGARLAQVLPEVTIRMMRATNIVLPKPIQGGVDIYKGSEARQREMAPASRIGNRAARRYNQCA